MDADTHKIYSTFNQTITATGRISSTEPNLQNIPVRLELGRELRKVFIPESDGNILLRFFSGNPQILAQAERTNTINNAEIHRLGITSLQGCNLVKRHMEHLRSCQPYALSEEPFNLNSPKQLGVILFEKLGLRGGKKTKTLPYQKPIPAAHIR